MGQLGSQVLLKKVSRVTQGHFQSEKQYKHHTITVIPDMEIQQVCSVQAMLTFLFSVIKDIVKWKSLDLDYILQGDTTFKHVGVNNPLAIDELILNKIIEGMKFYAKMLPH